MTCFIHSIFYTFFITAAYHYFIFYYFHHYLISYADLLSQRVVIYIYVHTCEQGGHPGFDGFQINFYYYLLIIIFSICSCINR